MNATRYKLGDIINTAGDTWEVIGVGWTNDEGRTYLHLVSTTRFVKQRNGKRPIMIADWI